MTHLEIEVIKSTERVTNPLPDDQWFFDADSDRPFIIEKAVIMEFTDGRYPQIQFTCRDPKTKKCISVGSTMRLLDKVVTMAKVVADKQGLKDY